MPRNKDLKRLVRARMKKTGEAYTTARTQTIKKHDKPRTSTTRVARQPDFAALAGKSDAVMKE